MENNMFEPARRRLLAGGLAGAFAAALPASARAQSAAASRRQSEPGEGPAKGVAAVSPLMRTVSNYIAEAGAKPLPEPVSVRSPAFRFAILRIERRDRAWLSSGS
jgi:hypothetical protein